MTAAREAHGISERRACSIIGADRSAMRYRHRRADDAATRTRLKELAARAPAVWLAAVEAAAGTGGDPHEPQEAATAV